MAANESTVFAGAWSDARRARLRDEPPVSSQPIFTWSTYVYTRQHMLSPREQMILSLIRDNPLVSQKELALRLGIQRSSVAGHIMSLANKGLIRGRGYILNEDRYVCVIGGANIDIEGQPDGLERQRDSNVGHIRRSAGGVGRNIAENLARLGVSTRLITALGDDGDGAWLRDETAAAGVDLADVRWSRNPTATYLSVLDYRGDMLVAVNDMNILVELDAEWIRARRETIRNAALVVLDCNLSADAIGELFDSHHGHVFFVDTVSAIKATRVGDFLARIHTLTPNQTEASLLSGIEISDERSLQRAADWFLERGIVQLFISLGKNGAFYACRGKRGICRAIEQSIVSATGAGDALSAGAVFGYLQGLSTEKSADVAMAAAYLTIQSERSVSENMSRDSLRRVLAPASP